VASALAVAQARLAIANGAAYDDFMSQLLAATVNAGRVALSVQAVLGAYGPDVNPHFWYDIPRVPRVAAAIEAALARLDPPDATVLGANLAAVDASLRSVEAVLASIRRRYPGAPPPPGLSPAGQERLALPQRRDAVLAPGISHRLQACLASGPGSRSSCSSRRTRASSSSRSSR